MPDQMLKLRRLRNREFKEIEGEARRLIRPAEYAIYRDEHCLAMLILAKDGWRVCVPTGNSRIGSAVSPVGFNKFSQVKNWALAYFGNSEWLRKRNKSGADEAGVSHDQGLHPSP